MIVETVSHQSVLAALALASRAPSVHNSQPWLWRLGPGFVHLYSDPRRWLPATDPDARDLLLSCGAVLHHLTVALAATEIAPTVHRLPNRAEPDHLAAVELMPGTGTVADLERAAAIPRRRTDRRRFADWPLNPGHLEELTKAAAGHGALLRAVTEPAHQRLLAAAIDFAAVEQDDTAGYPTEIAMWSGGRAEADGVPAANVPPAGQGATVLPMRRWADGDLAQRPSGRDGATILVLGTSSDDRLSQLRAGEACSAVLLAATGLGLAGSVLSQPLEVPVTRRLVRDGVLGGTMCPQLVIRVGWPPAGAPPLPATPRRPVSETLRPEPG